MCEEVRRGECVRNSQYFIFVILRCLVNKYGVIVDRFCVDILFPAVEVSGV